MTFLKLGQKESLVADPDIWLCFNCSDCSTRCPVNARPGRIMAAIRQMAVEHYAAPRSIGRLINNPKSFPLFVLVAALLLLGAIAVGGSFSPLRSPVRYSSMLPHLTLNFVFLAATTLAAISAFWGAARAWAAFAGEACLRLDFRRLISALGSAGREILSHRRFPAASSFRLADGHMPQYFMAS